jgi:hypothetical protein
MRFGISPTFALDIFTSHRNSQEVEYRTGKFGVSRDQ